MQLELDLGEPVQLPLPLVLEVLPDSDDYASLVAFFEACRDV